MKSRRGRFFGFVHGWIYIVILSLLTPSLQRGVVLSLGILSHSSAESCLDISRGDPAYTRITLSSPEITVRDSIVDAVSYQVFTMTDEPLIISEGGPVVPQISRYYRIPNMGGVELSIANDDYELVDDVFPLFNGRTDNSGTDAKTEDAWYPPHVAEMTQPMIMRDFRVVIVTLYPVQVNPVTHQARIYHHLEVSIQANDDPSVNEITHARRPSGSWAPIYRAMIGNLDESELYDVTITPGTILILSRTDESARRWADSLAIWKRRLGFDVAIDARTNWSASLMVTAIQSAYSTFDPPLEFVVLIGDPDWNLGVPTDGSNYDHTFALGNAGDDLEDIGVGRLSGTTLGQMAVINAKIMGYERNPRMIDSLGQPDSLWCSKGIFYATIANQQPGNLDLMQWGEHQFSTYTGVRNNVVTYIVGAVNGAQIATWFGEGIGYFFWQGTWVGQMDPSLPNILNSAWRLPICVVITEGTGNFAGGTGISEAYLQAGTLNNPKGGVAAIGCATFGVHWGPAAVYTAGQIYSMANLGIEHLGHSLNAAKLWLYLTYGYAAQDAQYMSRWVNLMGDPSLRMWTDIPVRMVVSHPDTIAVGTHQLSVEVYNSDNEPISDALVVAWKGDETYEKGLTDAQGQATLPISIQTSGQLSVTVSKLNHKPYLSDIECLTAGQLVNLLSYLLDDDDEGGTSGNSNGELNPGETIDLPVYLKNYGTEIAAPSGSARLTCENPNITLLNDSASYPALAPGDSALGSSPFRIQVSPVMPNAETASFVLTVIAGQEQTASRFYLICQAGELTYASYWTDLPLDPGQSCFLTVTLVNSGMLNMPNVTAGLHALDAYIGVVDSFAFYGNIEAGQQVTNTGDMFGIYASESARPGQIASLLLVATTSSNFVDSVAFTVSIGHVTMEDPAGPDEFGYFAYDNTDTSYELCPTYDYVPINEIGTNLGLDDPGEQTTPDPVYSTARPLPFTFRFYGTDYDTITICSNGWCAFGNQSWNDAFRNSPIPGILAPDAMIAPYWDDLRTMGTDRGVWDYFDATEHRYVIQWKAQGAFNSNPLDFEVILLDPAFHATLDGNGHVLMQYSQVEMNLPGDYHEPVGCTVGIQASGCLVGLSYAYGASYTSGAAPIAPGRTILFTTDLHVPQGGLQGRVFEALSADPLPGSHVNLEGFGGVAVADSDGFYSFETVPTGTYAVRASHHRYNDWLDADVGIPEDSTVNWDFYLLHPEIDIAVDSLNIVLNSQVLDTSMGIANEGSGPLDCALSLQYTSADTIQPWAEVLDIDVTDDIGDNHVYGCEYAFGEWWISGRLQNSQPGVHRFDPSGRFVGSYPVYSGGENGWFDLAFDGHYVFGSGVGEIVGMDSMGQESAGIQCPVNPARGIAYDPATDRFWVADHASDIYELDRSGSVVQIIDNSGWNALPITGLAWYGNDSTGMTLYVLSQAETGSPVVVTRIHPQTHIRQRVIELERQPDDLAGGCAITDIWDGTQTTFASVTQNPSGDIVHMRMMNFSTAWFSITPLTVTVPAGEMRTISMVLDPSPLAPITYSMRLGIRSEVQDTLLVIPVLVTVQPSSFDPRAGTNLPKDFALHQNFPNPFNPDTEIQFDLPMASHVTIRIFNTLGEEVVELVDEVRAAGIHRVRWDGRVHNGGYAASGMYICQMTTAEVSLVNKMLLLR